MSHYVCMLTLQGEALDRFAQMTNWDYYEAARRFQKVRISLLVSLTAAYHRLA